MKKYRDIYDPVEEVIGKFLSGVGNHPSEDDLISAIDHKYGKIHWEVLYLKRQGYNEQQICKILHIGEMSYKRAVEKLKVKRNWKEYNTNDQMERNKNKGKQALQKESREDRTN